MQSKTVDRTEKKNHSSRTESLQLSNLSLQLSSLRPTHYLSQPKTFRGRVLVNKKVIKTGPVSVMWPSYEIFTFCSLFSWFTAAMSTKARYAKKNYI